jgi:hypothetical protein
MFMSIPQKNGPLAIGANFQHSRNGKVKRCLSGIWWRDDGFDNAYRGSGEPDVVHPAWRASAIRVYRLWRDVGYVVGALLSGLVADLLGVASTMWLVAGMTFLSEVIAAVRLRDGSLPCAAW